METKNPVLVLDTTGSVAGFNIVEISNSSVPDELNGESGFHVYHVRMLTELILKQLLKTDAGYDLSEEKIQAISVASSLHDIGKRRVPKSILDFPGKLSPLEYDIVKKHSVLGEEIIDEASQEGVEPLVLTYAKEIARGHHERYDGMGYPDGKKGDAIPLSAQVVSLADAFDALTSVRNYKQAVSQDVAIEMIANGMSGVFNPTLVECLLQVINSKELLDIRDQYEKSRHVVSGKNIFVPKNVLFIGNTGYITESFIEETFPNCKIKLVGDSHLKSHGRFKRYSTRDASLEAIFNSYDFDIVIYFARELTYDSKKKSDSEELRQILEYFQSTQKDSKFLYLSSLDGAFKENTDRALLAKSKENLCEHYRNTYSLDIRVVRVPYLYSGIYQEDFLYRIFEKMSSGSSIKMEELSASRCYFLSVMDLSELLTRFFDNWKTGIGILNINDEFNLTFADFCKGLQSLKDAVTIDFEGTSPSKTLTTKNTAVRKEYGWFSKISVLDDLEEEYEKYLRQKEEIATTFFEKVKQWMKQHPLAVKLIELFGLFFITELLIILTKSATHFSIVDFRMAYVVIMATIHGLKFGIGAAGLASISWLIAKLLSGTSLLTLFYEPTNWLSFVYFFFVGSLCGYIRLKNDDTIKYMNDQNQLLEDKLIFTRELYNDTFEEKRMLKKQIIGSKDSFGKIFDVTRQLDTVEPRRLNLKIMDTFEDILENKSISVYSVTENSGFGRLEVASRDIISHVSRSISLTTYEPVLAKLKDNEVWKNNELIPGLPMYAAGVSRGGKLELMIFVWHAGQDQRTLYYVNLFKILCDLVQMSLLRAYDYNQAVYDKQYISGTNILNSEAFETVYENFKQMLDRKVFSYVQLEIGYGDNSLEQVNEMLQKKIRTNDILGLTKDGKLRLLLSQAGERDLDFILPRFNELDLEITVLKN